MLLETIVRIDPQDSAVLFVCTCGGEVRMANNVYSSGVCGRCGRTYHVGIVATPKQQPKLNPSIWLYEELLTPPPPPPPAKYLKINCACGYELTMLMRSDVASMCSNCGHVWEMKAEGLGPGRTGRWRKGPELEETKP